MTAPDNSQTTYTYDASGNELTRTDANNHVTSYGYDDADRETSVTTPMNEVWSYSYDANGNRTGVTTPGGGGSVGYGYDSLNRLTKIDYSDVTPDVTFSYDADGNRASMVDGAGTVSYAYDNRDRVTSITRGSSVFGYSYDPVGNVTERDYPDGRTVTYAYDDDGRLSTVTTSGQTSTYGYDAAGDETSLVLPSGNGYTESRSYDRSGRVSEVKDANGSSTLSQFDYVYDGDGNATKITTLSGEQNYTYDDLSRLTEVCYQATACAASDPHIVYTYDQVGNRLSESSDAGSTTYAYNPDDELTSATSGGTTTNYGYDSRGNEVQAGAGTFRFDLSDRMSSATDGGATTTYTYDGDGNRLSASDGATTTSYGWDTNWALPELISESQGGSLVRGYVYGSRVLSMSEGSGSYYFHADRLGSVVAVTSGGGQTEWQYSYDPFGNIRSQTEASGAPANPLGFIGQLQDSTTGLYDMRARMYDPTLGRFTGIDPLPAQSATPMIEAYDYAGQNPTGNVDPGGTMLEDANLVEGGRTPFGGVDLGRAGRSGETWIDPNKTWGNTSAVFVAKTGITAPKPYRSNHDYSSNPAIGDTFYDGLWNHAAYDHDICYGSQLHSRLDCDQHLHAELNAACAKAGLVAFACRIDAWVWYQAVRLYGASHYRPRHGN